MNVSYKEAIEQGVDSQVDKPDYQTVIIGAGIAGMASGIKLINENMTDFIILERAGSVGGTWRDNRYPGIAVDITSFTYSFSFEQNPNWSRVFAPGVDLHNYTKRIAAKYGLYPYFKFNIDVIRAVFNNEKNLWKLELSDGSTMTARFIISATGGLISPKDPDIPGLRSFKGEMVHTGKWDDSLDLEGKRVAIIGTGATAVQVIPAIADKVAHLDVYQRTPIWVLKKPDREIPPFIKSLFRNVPLLQRSTRIVTDVISESIMVVAGIYYKQVPWLVEWAEKAGVSNMEEQLPDRKDLWEALTPKYGFSCKRPTFSNVYFSTLGSDHVELVTNPIEKIQEDGIVTKDGTLRPIDILILATGYAVFEKGNIPSYELLGRNGQDIGDFWEKERYQAYEGVSAPNYPNFFTILGPYTFIGTSYFKTVEGNTTHAVRCIKEARDRKATCVEVKQGVHDAYFADIQKRQQNTIFLNHNCGLANSYYFDKHGDAPMLRPSTSLESLWRAKHFSLDNYRYTR
ncbi:MAG: NAD(P)/FAD-dependent oxidoreductase [Pseudomonadales bacterium]|nr:NAD(P)/FAD-dependent oxidoreductase [Pseudomonadales bacterium]